MNKEKIFTWSNPIDYRQRDNVVPLRDPFILKVGRVWYMTGTLPPYGLASECNGVRTKGVVLYKSENLTNWTFVDYIVKTPAEEEGKWYNDRFWAPELFCHNGKYYLTVNCCESDGSNHGFLFAVADAVEGPYTIMNTEAPLIHGNDAHLFVDHDGQVYLFSDGIWMAKIDLENLRLLTEKKYIACPIPRSTAWNAEREGVDFEGPFVIRRGENYYLFYSTWSRGYEVGVAVTQSLDEPWKMYPNPMYGAMDQSWCDRWGGIYEEGYYVAQDKYGQCGHNSVFEGPDGQMWIAAHTYDVGRGMQEVKLAIDKLIFDEERGIVAMDVTNGRIVNGPTRGKASFAYDPANAVSASVKALDVWGYAAVNGNYQLPSMVDILLENGFRECASVTWESAPVLTECGEQMIQGTAVYNGCSYPVSAHVFILKS